MMRTSRRAVLISTLSLALPVSCAATAPSAPKPAAAPSASASGATSAPTAPSGSASAARRVVPTDAWRVLTFAKFAKRGATPESEELWPTLEHTWPDACGPGPVLAQRRLCMPKGKYVFESRSSDHLELTVNGTPIIGPRIEVSRVIEGGPAELSSPIEIDGCVLVRAAMHNEGCYPKAHIKLTVRDAVQTAPCDETSFPKDTWNACIFAGRQKEELQKVEEWKELVGRGGPKGWEDNFSVEARTTVCFDRGKYVLHAHVPGNRMQLYMDDALTFEPQPRTARHVTDTEPIELSGCHKLRATYVALDHDTAFELQWAKVGSPRERQWSDDASRCDPACASDASCVAGAPFGIERKGAKVCLPRGRTSHLGEACTETQRCGGTESSCCRPGHCGGSVKGVCTYHDR